ncbi:hypothetical protein Tco_0222384 [Tanacetum coccineum]
MMIFNDMHEPHAQSVSDTTRNTVVDNSLTAELATYKEQVELYERRARFDLTEREQKIDEQLRIVITDRNIKEENLKKELHSVEMQLASTINHNKSMVEEVTSLKKDFKQKENKYLEEFLDMKALKEKVKIAPRDYSKENYLATFTPQKQLTPEQIFWSHDLIKMKEETLKSQTTTLRPIKASTVYPPNTHATLVPRVLPTKSQVKFNIFALIQLFLEFEKTCKKRITPTGLTEAERGFEQTKECYLTEVIPFFKTLKEHFEGIQKALTKEIKKMKDIFKELEAEDDQNVVNRKHDEIEQKNLLIANDNLIVDCLSKEVFYIATNFELTVSRFTEMHEAHTIVQTRCLELEAELYKLRDKVQKDDHTELVKCFSNLEVNHLNLQLKYLNLKESFGNDPSPPARDTLDFDSVFVIEKMKASIQGKDNDIKKIKNANLSIEKDPYAIDVELIPPHNRNNREDHLYYFKHLKKSVETLREIVEEAKVERPLDRTIVSACRYTKHSQEILEYAIDTCPKAFNQQDKKHAPTPVIRKKQVTFEEQCDTSNSNTYKHLEQLNTQKTNVPMPSSTEVVQIVLWYLDSSCSKHMTGDHLRLRNFMKKFIETVRFGNDHFGAIMGYGDYVIGDSTEAVATACYTQNRSLIHTLHNKTSYELCIIRILILPFFRVFGALYYPTNDNEDLGKLQPTTDIGIFVSYAPSRKGTGPAPSFLTSGQISSGLVPNLVPAAPYVPPINKELEILFQLMFDEYLEPTRVERLVSPAPAVSVSITSTGVATEPTLMEDNPFPPVDYDPFVNVFALEPSSEASSSGDLSLAESPYVTQTLHHLGKWIKDHPLNNIIGNPSRLVSTRKQLATDALWCLYNSILSKVEPKNFKSAITEDW